MLTESVITGLSILTIIGNVFLIVSLFLLITKKRFPKGFYKIINKHNLLFASIIALIATSGSLFFSEIAHFMPCELCWFQRIFMYPLSIILLIALVKKDQSVKRYIIPLAVIGAAFAAYHYTIQILNVSTVCSAEGTSCTTSYPLHFGYISIPMMALTAFFMIIVFLTIYGKKK